MLICVCVCARAYTQQRRDQLTEGALNSTLIRMTGLDLEDASSDLEAGADLLSHIHSLICAIAPRTDFQSELQMLLKQVFCLRLAFNGLAGAKINLQHLAFAQKELSSYTLRQQSAKKFKNYALLRAQHSLEKLHQELLGQENKKSFIFVQPSYKVHEFMFSSSGPELEFKPSERLTSSFQTKIEQKMLLTSPFQLDLDDSIKHFLSQSSIKLRIMGIFGQGGIGKTTLLLRILQMLQSQKAFSLIAYVELLDGKAIMEVQISVLLQLGGSVHDVSNARSARDALLVRFHELAAANESVCVAFHNVMFEIEDLLDWIPLGDSSLMSCIMITSRKEIDIESTAQSAEGSRALCVEQKPLPPETARDLLLAYASVKGTIKQEVEVIKLVDEIYPLCGGIPLALKSVGARLAQVRDLDFWDGWKSKMKESMGFPLANEFKLTGILERSYRHLQEDSQEALFDIATFLHGWNWVTVESFLGTPAMNQLRRFFLIYRTNQLEFGSSDISHFYAGPAYVIMHDLVRKLVVETMGKTCLVLGNQEECSTLLLSNTCTVLRGVRCLRVEIPMQNRDEDCSSTLSTSAWEGNGFSGMQSLRVLDLSGYFECTSELRLPESLRYLRLVNNDGLTNQLTKSRIPSNLWHFEVQQCEGLVELPLSIYGCKDLRSLKLCDCPHLRGFRSYSNWKKLKELHIKGCHAITQLPIDLPPFMQALTLYDCLNLQALPPCFSETFVLTVEIERCPHLMAAPDNLDVGAASSSPPITSKAIHTTVITPINMQKSTLQLNSPADHDQMRSQVQGVPAHHECGKTWKLSLTSAVQLTLQDCDCVELKVLGFEDMKNLQKLKLRNCQRLLRLPRSICKLKSLVVLDLHGCSELQELPWDIQDLSALQVLDLSECRKLQELPWSLSAIESLKELNLCGCAELRNLPSRMERFSSLKILRLANCQSIASRHLEKICSLKSLVHLDLHGCYKLEELPEQIGRLSALDTLFLMECHSIRMLPSSIYHLQSLRVLSINGSSQIKELPEQMKGLRAMRVFSAANCGSLQNLCKSFCELQSLSVLDLQGCLKLEELPQEFGYNLRSLSSLLLMECPRLKRLPEGICRMPLLEELDLSGCLALGRLPADMGNLSALKKLRLANCQSLQRLPDSVCQLQSLANLDLHGCYKLEALPRDFGKLSALQSLNLLKCQTLELLPESVCGLESLRELDMRGSLVEQAVLKEKNSYFVGCEKVRSFLRFLRSQLEAGA